MKLAPDVLFRVASEEAVIVDLKGDKVFELNQTGGRVVELIAAGHPVDKILGMLFEEYSVDHSAIKEEVSALTQSLLDRGLVVEG